MTSGTEVETLTAINLISATMNVTFNAPTITGTGAGQFSVLPYISGSQSTCLQISPKSSTPPRRDVHGYSPIHINGFRNQLQRDAQCLRQRSGWIPASCHDCERLGLKLTTCCTSRP